MTDPATATTPLTDQTLRRLRALAKGNGIEPDSITLLQNDEQNHTIEAVMTLTPFCDAEISRHAGPPRSKDALMMESPQALQTEITRRKQALTAHPAWIEGVRQELQSAAGQGWGLDQAKVSLAKESITLAAVGACPDCHGKRMVTCAACQGRGFEPCFQCRTTRQEICYNCAGSGLDPQNQNSPCVICRGMRYIPCRLCRATGEITCRTCGGKRGTPCPGCQGAGQITEEARLTCGATTHFNLKGGNLPSGMRRGLDRLGVANLAKGHADIEMVAPKQEPEEEGFYDEDHVPENPQKPELQYIARLPFAELKIDFGGKKAVIGAFGKRGVPVDVPPFLDEPLKPWRDKLKAAAREHSGIDDAIKARALHDALSLELQGKGSVKEFRRLYPVGISAATAQEIMQNTRKAIKRATVAMRAGVAILCALLSAGFFAGCYFTSLPAQLAGRPKWYGLALDFAPPVLAASAAWAFLNAATSLILRKRFPDTPVGLKQAAGKTGVTMAAAILVFWAVLLVLSPAKPLWLSFIH